MNVRDRALRPVPDPERALGTVLGALEVLPLGVVVFDADGNEIARNQPAVALTGEPVADRCVAEAIRDVVARVGDERSEATVELHGPPLRVVRASAERLACGAFVALVEDVSERHRLDAVRRDFVTNVSHELRTPIGALGVLAEAMAAEDDPGVVRRLVERVSAEAERAARLVADLLDLGRIESEAPHLREIVAVDTIVEAAVQGVAALAERSGIVVDVRVTCPSPAVEGDGAQLVSAVANLLQNAVAYSDPGAVVTVAVDVEDRWVRVAVTDQGIGIPHDDLQRIFERFYRVDRARDRRTGGTGLGLAIVRHVATNHGGGVDVVSTEGVGSTFTLRLPGCR